MLLPVGLKSASVIGAEAESPEVFRVLSALDRTGHPLTGVFHIHPGAGRQANCPSSVDASYMKRLAGRQLVFGIWARDGFLRLLTLPDKQEVHLFGDGVEDLGKEGNERIFRFQNRDNLFWATARGLPQQWQWDENWSDRQERIARFDQQAVANAFVWVFGCNGLGRTLAEFLVRKGYGRVGICDDDIVEVTNLNRTLWRHGAVGKFKAVQALVELAEIAPGRTEILAYVGKLQEILASTLIKGATACLIGIDNDRGRAEAAKALREVGKLHR